MNRTVPVLAAMLLSGCAAVADGPSPASVTVPERFAYADQPGSGVTDQRVVLANLLPEDDPAFVALVAAIDGDAPDVQAALARVEAARAALRTSRASRLPTVEAIGSAGVTRSSENAIVNQIPGGAFDASSSLWSPGISASWELDLFGRVKASQRAATQRLNAADEDVRAVRLTLVADLARAVIDYRTAQAKVRIAEEDLAEAKALSQLTGIRVRAGISPGFDLVTAQSLEAAALAARAPAEVELASALGSIVTLTARDGPTVALAFGAMPPEVKAASLPSVGLPSTLLRQRPDVVAAEYRLTAANADIAAAAAARFPEFSISATLGLAAIALGDLFSADSLTASAGASIAGPLLDFGRVAAQIDARQADAKEAFAVYRGTVFRAIGEGETALGTLRASRNRLTSLASQLAIEQDTVNLARQRYRMGLSDFLSVVNVQRQLNVTRERYANAAGDVQRAEIEIYRSFGG